MEYIKKFLNALYYAIFIEGDTLAQKKNTEEDETASDTSNQNETSGD